MNAFPVQDHAKGFKDLNLDVDPTPIQRSLGLSWDVKRDTFTFQVTDIKKNFYSQRDTCYCEQSL